MICKYCQAIHVLDDSYPLRQATKDVDGECPRCNWHWRFVCSICGRPRHFNGMAWCDKNRRFVCIRCAKSRRVARRRFWSWKYYYTSKCSLCGKHHPALDYLEYTGKHPWQLYPEMEKNHKGLDPATRLTRIPADYVPLEKAASEAQISQAWDRVAHEWANGYTEYGDLNRKYVINPAIFRLIGSVKGLNILDAGCGNGYLCRILAQRGAQLVGIDISNEFMKMAMQKEKQRPLGIKYYVGSICDMNMCQGETFELAISNLALMDLPDLDKAIRELHRVLKRNGRLIFSIMHPCFASPPVHGWIRVPFDTDRKEDRIYWKVDRYFDRTMEIWRLSDADAPPLYSFHRPVSEYVKTLLKHGFAITDLDEPMPSKKAIQEHYREFGDEYERVPWFMIIAAKKL